MLFGRYEHEVLGKYASLDSALVMDLQTFRDLTSVVLPRYSVGS